MTLKEIHIVLLLALVFLSCGRGDEKRHERFERIDALCDSDPRLAMSMLDSIDYASLSPRDRHRYDLLSIKSKDKAYLRHNSDSLILDVIDYYSRHKADRHYPEALYYGGRVYSDMGDLPTALKYFQDALDEIPDSKENLRLLRNALNQTGRLLHSLRLDSSAIMYMEKSIEANEKLGYHDSGIAFAHKLLGNSYRNIGDKENARKHIDLAMKYSPSLSVADRADILTALADILTMEGKQDSALQVIRMLPEAIDYLSRAEWLAVASEIYRNAGIKDTAYIFARKLTLLNNPSNKRTGYKVIFSDELSDYVPKDTLLALIPEYKLTIEEYLDTHEGENAITQNTRYNYDTHERERKKTEARLNKVILVAVIAVIISLILLSLFIYSKFRKSEKKARIMTAISLMKEDNQFISTASADYNSSSDEREESISISEQKMKILSEIYKMDEKQICRLVNQTILGSKIYNELSEKIKSKICIKVSEEERIWNELEELIETAAPGFFKRLAILTEDNISPNERKVAMLMKCGFSPLQISILLGRQKNTISTHRRNLAEKISGQKKADRNLDLIIISL